MRGYYRYLTHEDNPEKVEYKKEDIKLLNEFITSIFIELTKSEVIKLKNKIFELILNNDLAEYCHLIDLIRGSTKMGIKE